MANIRKDNGDPNDVPGVRGQVSRLRVHSGATAAEIRQFIGQLRGRSPHEVIGVLAQSNLLRATGLAAAWTVGLLLVFTILPAIFAKPKNVETATPVAATAPAADKSKPAVTDGKDSTAVAPDTKTKPASKTDVADKLGIGETKTLDPKKNPLDGVGDDLFKDIK